MSLAFARIYHGAFLDYRLTLTMKILAHLVLIYSWTTIIMF